MRGSEVFYGDTLLKGVSSDGFECLVDDKYGMYAQNVKGIWYFQQHGARHTTRFVTADASCFEVLGHGYAADADTVFYFGLPIKSAMPSSFRVVSDLFAADDGAVYVDSSAAEGFQIWTDFDAASLQFFDAEKGFISEIFADRFQMYVFNHHFVQYADPHSPRYRKQKEVLRKRLPDATAWWNLADNFSNDLTPIGENYFTNGTFVFYHFKKHDDPRVQYSLPLHDDSYLILPDADPGTFKALNGTYGLDETHVYCLNKKITADTTTFQVLEDAFGHDCAGLWYNGFHVPACCVSDVKIHTTERSTFALDKDHLFCVKECVRIGKGKGYARQLRLEKKGDPGSFKVLSPAFAKDKNQVYWYGEVWKAPDPETFEWVMENRCSEFAKDRHHLYRAAGKKVFKQVDGASFQLINAFWAKDKKSVIYMGWGGDVLRHADYDSFEVLDDAGSAQDARKHYWVSGDEVKSRPR
ncbi:DKNYY domain-containing protein [Marivita sp. S0852]|uniref:DKNYY domain-containing protein n=2 Tax=Marivita sp. S0852 TaxID=3373893 RepID=UPI003982CF7A